MKKIIIFLMFCACAKIFAQSQFSDKNDSINPHIDVVLYDDHVHDISPDLYVNGKLQPISLLKTLNDSIVDEIKIIKDASARSKGGEVHVTLKNNYQPQIISLSKLKEKYIHCIDSIPSLFLLKMS